MQAVPTPTPETIGAQRADADLLALAGITTTGLLERTGAGTASTATITAFAKTLLDDADAATARTTLGLGSAALGTITEATWTPAILGTTTAGVGTYTSREGYFWRLGNLCIVKYQAQWTGHTGAGPIQIGNLPVAVGNSFAKRGVGIFYRMSITTPANAVLTAIPLAGTTSIQIAYQVVGGGTFAVLPIATTGILEGIVIYWAD